MTVVAEMAWRKEPPDSVGWWVGRFDERGANRPERVYTYPITQLPVPNYGCHWWMGPLPEPKDES